MMTRRRRFLFGHSALVVTTFALMLAGLVLVSRGEHGFANTASAQVGSHLQIAPASAPSAWSDSTGPAWGFAPGAPGTQTSGYVWLRSVDVSHPNTTSMTLQAVLDAGSTPGFAAQIVVTHMELGSTDLLPLWNACASSNGLTLADLASCAASPKLPTPPGDTGATFAMVFEMDQATGNAFQGATLGARFVFTLNDTTPPDIIIPLSPTATASASATPSGTDSATATPSSTPTDTQTPATATATPGSNATNTPTPGNGLEATGGTDDPKATVTPVAPYTGSGAKSDGGLGAELLMAGAVMLAAWLMVMLLLARKKRQEETR